MPKVTMSRRGVKARASIRLPRLASGCRAAIEVMLATTSGSTDPYTTPDPERPGGIGGLVGLRVGSLATNVVGSLTRKRVVAAHFVNVRRVVTATASSHRGGAAAAQRSASPSNAPWLSSEYHAASPSETTAAAILGVRVNSSAGCRRCEANTGHVQQVMPAAMTASSCGSEYPRCGWRNTAINSTATPPAASRARPTGLADRSPIAVSRKQRPTPARAEVITQESVAPCPASSLIVSRTGSYEGG